jgi:hypothetical protein
MCDEVLQACGCVRIYTLAKQVSEGCLRLLLENVIPRLEVIENLNSDNGSHFTANVLKGSRDLGMSYSLASSFLRELKE